MGTRNGGTFQWDECVALGVATRERSAAAASAFPAGARFPQWPLGLGAKLTCVPRAACARVIFQQKKNFPIAFTLNSCVRPFRGLQFEIRAKRVPSEMKL